MAKDKQEKEVRCSFCGKPQDEAFKLVAGPGVAICDECIVLCSEILNSDDKELEQIIHKTKEIPTPKEIKEVLDQYVIGQENAKKTLAVAVYNHYKRIKYNNKISDVEIQKSNILMLGPTGCGKTLLAQTLAKVLNVPFAIADATTLTEAGYVGEDVENILLRLIQAADYDIKRAERGIIYIDEIDKISRKSENPSITRDVSGEGVQQALLKIIEGTVAAVPPQGGRKHPQQENIRIDTKNILFICGGAFEGLEKIINARVGTKGMGFGSEVKSKKDLNLTKCFEQLQPQDLLKFGIIPELVGRLPVITTLTQLDENALVEILTKPKNSLIKQYKKLFEVDGIELVFEEDAINAIVKKAVERNTGARGLRSIFEDSMKEIMFELPSMKDIEKCVITKECIEKGEMPDLVKKESVKRVTKDIPVSEDNKEAI